MNVSDDVKTVLVPMASRPHHGNCLLWVHLVNMFVFFPAQEQMSDSEGEDGDDVDIRDLFDEPQIEQNLHQLDNDRQQQVHAHVDEVKNLIDYIVYSIHLSVFIQNWTGDSMLFLQYLQDNSGLVDALA